MERPANSTSVPTSSQPQSMTGGPPCRGPKPYSVRQPERIEMIVNDTAKFEKPLMLLSSSWA